jgi:uncharacterized repeat protein (TIGR03837 family)
MPALSCDIFCKVVDNYGDIGFCWRLARQFHEDHSLTVRLWVDDLASFCRIAPAVDPDARRQRLEGIEIHAWTAEIPPVVPADIVIEAFACELPANYLAAMAERETPVAWINLDYLSAESWVEDCHGMPSPHPRFALTRHFFFPGFTTRTGGLLKEAGLNTTQSRFLGLPDAQAGFWAGLGIPQPQADRLHISLFAYENAALPSLLDAWAHGERPVSCVLPEGRLLPAAANWAGEKLTAGTSLERGKLHLHVTPFLSQVAYDRLLWACDLNFVRGEDSFVRAHWARKPFVWHIYRQEGDAHRPKLDAFLARYEEGLHIPAAEALRDFWHAWDREEDVGAVWPPFAARLEELQHHAGDWADTMSAQGDLASKLLIFCKNLLQ